MNARADYAAIFIPALELVLVLVITIPPPGTLPKRAVKTSLMGPRKPCEQG